MNSRRLCFFLAVGSIIAGLVAPAEAGDRLFRRKARPIRETITTSRPQDQVTPSTMLGSFRSTPYVNIGGRTMAAGVFGRENSPEVYGPLSFFRSYAAPVQTVVRGYDGVPTIVEGTAFSTPNMPSLSPVVYPTRASNYSALRYQTTSPYLDRATNWIDQN